MPIQIPEERLAGAAGVGIFLGAPKRINLRVIPLNAFTLRQVRFKYGKNLKPGTAIVFAFVRVEWPKVSAPLIGAGFGILLDRV